MWYKRIHFITISIMLLLVGCRNNSQPTTPSDEKKDVSHGKSPSGGVIFAQNPDFRINFEATFSYVANKNGNGGSALKVFGPENVATIDW